MLILLGNSILTVEGVYRQEMRKAKKNPVELDYKHSI